MRYWGIFLVVPLALFAQRGAITGFVKDFTGKPISGAKVIFLDTPTFLPESTSTDAGGRFTFDVPAGKYRSLFIFKEGYKIKMLSYTVEAKPGLRLDIGSITLEEARRGLYIFSFPVGADVYVNNKMIGVTPFQDTSVTGFVNIKLQKEGYKEVSFSLDIKPDEPTYKIVKLEPLVTTLVVQTLPGAVIWVDGDSIGVAPKTGVFKKEITVGTHKIEITKKNYSPFSRLIKAVEGRPAVIYAMRLTPGTGTFTIISRPRGAKVYINDKLKGITNITLPVTKRERWLIRLSKANYNDYVTQVEVDPRKKTRIYIDLEPLSAYLFLKGYPPGAKVYLDEIFIDSLPFTRKREVPAGAHVLKIGYPGFHPKVVKLELIVNQLWEDTTIRLRSKSALEAAIFSALLPGWGQFWSGRKLEGIMCVVLQLGGLVWLGLTGYQYSEMASILEERAARYLSQQTSTGIDSVGALYEKTYNRCVKLYTNYKMAMWVNVGIYLFNIFDAFLTMPKPKVGAKARNMRVKTRPEPTPKKENKTGKSEKK